jgi:hypothetical protein
MMLSRIGFRAGASSLAILMVVVPAGLVGCSSDSTPTADDTAVVSMSPTVMAPEEAVAAYFDAWNSRDVDQIMALIGDGPQIEIRQGYSLSDPAEIRAQFDALLSRADWTIEISSVTVNGDTVTYNYEITGADGVSRERGRSQAVVKDGLVMSEKQIGEYQE